MEPRSVLSDWLWIASLSHRAGGDDIAGGVWLFVFGPLLVWPVFGGRARLVLINLLNRITDVAEDSHNQVPGTARVAQNKTALTVLATVLPVRRLR